ncbi:MAG TPA: hypothetical protein VGB18_05145 [Candidatus Thermoplasmatota archaeon]
MRWTWWHFAALAAIGIALTTLSIAGGWPWGGFFLLLPLIFPPLKLGKALRNPPEWKFCGTCRWASSDSQYEYCPRDGTKLLRQNR